VDFKIVKFLTVGRSRGSNCISLPNFVKIAVTAARYGVLGFFKMAAAAILDFRN